MQHPPLLVLGYSEAAMFLRGRPDPPIGAILSIHGGREFGVEAEDVAMRLDLAFDDVDVLDESDPRSLHRALTRQRHDARNGLQRTPPGRADVEAIIRFAEAVHGVKGAVLCHCGGGMSRAPAAALICLAVWRGRGTEQACVEQVLGLRRGATPHAGLVRIADELLDRSGQLVGSLEDRLR